MDTYRFCVLERTDTDCVYVGFVCEKVLFKKMYFCSCNEVYNIYS